METTTYYHLPHHLPPTTAARVTADPYELPPTAATAISAIVPPPTITTPYRCYLLPSPAITVTRITSYHRLWPPLPTASLLHTYTRAHMRVLYSSTLLSSLLLSVHPQTHTEHDIHIKMAHVQRALNINEIPLLPSLGKLPLAWGGSLACQGGRLHPRGWGML